MQPDATFIFKDACLVEFLDLPPQRSEADLQRALVEQLKQFLTELSRDFCDIGSQNSIQVGGRDFAFDLLFFNRALNCLVACDLKVVENVALPFDAINKTSLSMPLTGYTIFPGPSK